MCFSKVFFENRIGAQVFVFKLTSVDEFSDTGDVFRICRGARLVELGGDEESALFPSGDVVHG